MLMEAERAEVAAAGRRAAEARLVIGSAGNVGLRVEERLLLSATGVRLAELTAETVAVVDLRSGTTLEGPPPSTELALHQALFAERAERALVHTHSRLATALACVLDDELPLVHYAMLELGGPVRVAPYARFGSPELAALTVEALRGRCAALMASHGAVTIGADLDQAVERAILLE